MNIKLLWPPVDLRTVATPPPVPSHPCLKITFPHCPTQCLLHTTQFWPSRCNVYAADDCCWDCFPIFPPVCPFATGHRFPPEKKDLRNSWNCVSHGEIKQGLVFYRGCHINGITGKHWRKMSPVMTPGNTTKPSWQRPCDFSRRTYSDSQPLACSVPFSWKFSAGVLTSEERDQPLAFKKNYCSSRGCRYCQSQIGPFDLKWHLNSQLIQLIRSNEWQ